MPQDDDGLDLDALERALDAGDRRRSSTRSRPSRTRAAARCRSSAGAGSSSSRASARLPVLEDDPYGLVRFEGDAAAEAARARGRRARDLHLVVLEDGRARRSASATSCCPTRPRLARSRRRADARTSRRCCSARRRCYEFVRRGALRAEPRARPRAAAGAPRRDARRARARARRRPRRGAGPRAATSSGWTCRTDVDAAALLERATRGGRHVRAAARTSSPAAAADAPPRGSRSASSRRTRSARASRGSPRCCPTRRLATRQRLRGEDDRRAGRARAWRGGRRRATPRLGAEGRADGLRREGAEPGAAEVAVVAGATVALLIVSLPRLSRAAPTVVDTASRGRPRQALPRRKRAISGGFRTCRESALLCCRGRVASARNAC